MNAMHPPAAQPRAAHSSADEPTPPALPADAGAALAEFGPRLVTLCSGQPGLRGTLSVAAAAPAAPATDATAPAALPVMDFIASDATLDRAGEILQPEGWRLDNYRRNPVFQNAHNYGNILFTLGRATEVEVRAGRLWLRVQFATHINPLARMAYELYRGGFLRAVSVGFIPLRWENGNGHTPWRRRFLEQELIEVSAVAVPANPNALLLAAKAGAVGAGELRELHALLLATLACLPAPSATVPALALLARQTARLLRPGASLSPQSATR